MDGERSFEQIRGHLGKPAAASGEDGARLRRCALLFDRLSNAEPIQRAHRVRKQGDARAGGVDAWRALEDEASCRARRKPTAAARPPIPPPTTMTRMT